MGSVMKKYNHAFALAFSINSDHPDGDDITGEEFTAAVQRRVDDINSSGDLEWSEAVGIPYDTYENQSCPPEKQEVIDEVELVAHSAYAGTRKQDNLLLALSILQRLPQERFEQ
jgi:hypothetical protein